MSQCGRPARLHNLPNYSPGWLINPYVRFHFYLWVRWSWRYTYFMHILRCSKLVFQTETWIKKVLKMSHFCKKKTFLGFFFWDPRPKSQILTPHPCPPVWKFFIRYIEQWTKIFCKKTGRPGRSETGRPAGQPAMILKFTGRVGSRKSWPVPSLLWTTFRRP